LDLIVFAWSFFAANVFGLAASGDNLNQDLNKNLDNAYRLCYYSYNDVVTVVTSDGRHAILASQGDVSVPAH
jgi:hypothetical protein